MHSEFEEKYFPTDLVETSDKVVEVFCIDQQN